MLALAQQGLPVKAVMNRIKNEWTLYAKSDIASCADLDGVKLAIHSEGSPATFMVRDYIENECPGTEPQYPPDLPFDLVHLDAELRLDLEAQVLEGAVTHTVRAKDAG